MKKTLYLLFLLLSLLSYAAEDPNRFADSENGSEPFSRESGNTNQTTGPVTSNFSGNPADPVPIDTYIPFLLMTAVGIMVYQTHKKKKTLSKNTSK